MHYDDEYDEYDEDDDEYHKKIFLEEALFVK